MGPAPAQAFGRGLGEVKGVEEPDDGLARQGVGSHGERLVYDLFHGGPDG
jgi:hypothetical protein